MDYASRLVYAARAMRLKSLPVHDRPESFWDECLSFVPAWHRHAQREAIIDAYRSAIGKDAKDLTEPERVAIRIGAGFKMSGSTVFMCAREPSLEVLSIDGEFFVERVASDQQVKSPSP